MLLQLPISSTKFIFESGFWNSCSTTANFALFSKVVLLLGSNFISKPKMNDVTMNSNKINGSRSREIEDGTFHAGNPMCTNYYFEFENLNKRTT
jgi:hypothetical protein